jgi:hypothetical protein
VARESQFQMNVPARRLSLRQSHTVALVTTEYGAGSSVPDSFMLEILSGISRGLHGNDYDPLMVHADETDLDLDPSRPADRPGRRLHPALADLHPGTGREAGRAAGAVHHLGRPAGARLLHGQR